MALSRDDFITPRALKREFVDIPELGGEAWVSVMTAREWGELQDYLVKNPEYRVADLHGLIAVLTLCDAEGARLMKREDADTLVASVDHVSLGRIVEVARRINGIGQGDELEKA